MTAELKTHKYITFNNTPMILSGLNRKFLSLCRPYGCRNLLIEVQSNLLEECVFLNPEKKMIDSELY
jgi:hypothetical protein